MGLEGGGGGGGGGVLEKTGLGSPLSVFVRLFDQGGGFFVPKWVGLGVS